MSRIARRMVLVAAVLALSLAGGCTGKHNVPILVVRDVAVRYDAGWYAGSVLGEHEGARKEFEAVVSMAPEFAEGHHNLGVSLAYLGRWDASLAAFDRAVRINPDLGLSAAGVVVASRSRRGETASPSEIPRLCKQFHKLDQEGC